MKKNLSKVLSFFAAFTCFVPLSHANVASNGLICLDNEIANLGWSDANNPTIAYVAHWFDDERVSTVVWTRKNDIINMIKSRSGVKYETDISTIFWSVKSPNGTRKIQINRSTLERSVISDGEEINKVNCELVTKERDYTQKLDSITSDIQSKYDNAISANKL